MKPARTTHRRRGVTLADVTITALIIGILAAVTAPRFFDTLGALQLEAAAKQVAADLKYARQLAKTKGRDQSVTFTPASDTYELNGANDIYRSGDPFIVVLPDTSHPAEIDSAIFGGGPTVTFDMHGQPDNGGTVVISKHGVTKSIEVNATTGEASIP